MANNKITAEELADTMESLGKFTPHDLVRALRFTYQRPVLVSSIRCRLARLALRIDPSTDESAITKCKEGTTLYYTVSRLQADRIRCQASFLSESKRKKSIEAKFREDGVSLRHWGDRLVGAPGDTVFVMSNQ